MKKNFIFFRNDRLGDFIIISNLIEAVKAKYPNSTITVLCSINNHKLVKKYKSVDRVILYNKSYSLLKKINIFKKIINLNYFASFAVDGKSFSYLCNYFISCKYKLGLVYKYNLFSLNFYKPNYFYKKFVFDKFETFTSKKYLKNIEHLPSKIQKLGNFLGLKLNAKDKYIYPTSQVEHKHFKTIFKKKIKGKYILIHFDEKWLDLRDINNDLTYFVNKLQILSKKKIIISSYNNNFIYYLNLKQGLQKLKNDKIILIENMNLHFLERVIKFSFCSISCHSGFLVQVGGSNTANLIDIINKRDLIWYSCWKPKNTNHNFIFKSDLKKIPLIKILNSILLKIVKFK